MKLCRDCGKELPLTEFTRNRNSRDGHAFYCKRHARLRHQASRDRRTGGPRTRFPRGLEVPDGHKWCPDCGVVKDVGAFGRNAGNKSGLNSYCKPCHDARTRRSKELIGGERTYHLRRRYGITAADADRMLAEQGGLCAICRAAPAVHVDHDHATDAVRQLLCFNCNGGLGQFKDDPTVLRAAAEYVERHRELQRRAGTRPSAARRDEVTSRPQSPPVGSSQRPQRSSTSARRTRMTSTDGRHRTAGEADT